MPLLITKREGWDTSDTHLSHLSPTQSPAGIWGSPGNKETEVLVSGHQKVQGPVRYTSKL